MSKIVAHLRGHVVAYLALFVALGGTSYAAVRIQPGSVGTRALAGRAVTHAKLAPSSVDTANVIDGSLTSADFAPGTLLAVRGAAGPGGTPGPKGDPGAPGANGANGANGAGAVLGVRARGSGAVVAPHGASTSVPLTGNAWTQAPGEVDLIVGSVTLKPPSTCTGSFGNSLVVKVDGVVTTFAVAPTLAPSGSVTVPLVVGTLMEPAASTPHQLTAELANSCTKAGEDFSVTDVKIDILTFS
ncbi:MAG: hypothetical protein QOK40_843 [Miltoncostaeaceae bacterium]|jgi:hypothetical protein|nr:hypothetical protein [Miltoncostaeaceae bacterium]